MTFRKMADSDLESVVRLLVRAFMGTPFHQAIIPNSSEREAFLTISFSGRMRRALGYNDTDLACGETGILGLASWIPPEDPAAPPRPAPPSVEEEFASLSAEVRKRYADFLVILHSELEKSIRQPFWDLAPLAVSPEAQGQGVASALMARKFAEADAAGIPIAIETQDERNLVIYQKWGFQTVSRVFLFPPEIWSTTMVRWPPAAGTT